MKKMKDTVDKRGYFATVPDDPKYKIQGPFWAEVSPPALLQALHDYCRLEPGDQIEIVGQGRPSRNRGEWRPVILNYEITLEDLSYYKQWLKEAKKDWPEFNAKPNQDISRRRPAA
jgi:hypothetical protein